MPKHPKTKTVSSTRGPHPGGPLKRTGSRAEEWDTLVGPSLETIPSSQLPLCKTILQRYRGLRVENNQKPVMELAKVISIEVIAIWERARVPTVSKKNCHRKIHEFILEWKKHHNPGEVSDKFVNKLNSLMDLKPKLKGKPTEEAELKNLREIMRQNADVKRRRTLEGGVQQYDWEADYDFYIDQFKVISTRSLYIINHYIM